ncbi:MAG: molybdenum cofactor guanylyltransferase [Negativicutes bacterium]|nr:molybdenum cofactor guanylyltransferase [Negativicutes bacterium]MDR3591825.1 molybdenum cofactor guanylyltransferase [Negativicutes bacterium]
MTEKPALTGIVLAGGRSVRMGSDKASLPWRGGDLLHAVLNALTPVCSELIVVSNSPRVITLPDVRVVADSYPGCGPLGGIHAGLAASGSDYNFVVACDMPYIDGRAAKYMAAAASGFDVAVPFIDGYFHPLHAVYHRRCLPVVEKMLTSGRYRIVDLYPEVRLRLVNAEELAQFSPDFAIFRNLNSPADLCNL